MRTISVVAYMGCFLDLQAFYHAAEAKPLLPGASPIIPSYFQIQNPKLHFLPSSPDASTDIHGLKAPIAGGLRSGPLAEDLIDAIARMEGIFDQTRVGYFGPSLRMKIRAGTAIMTNVAEGTWKRLSLDPNIHLRAHFFGEIWFGEDRKVCADFKKFRPERLLVVLDQLTPSECKLTNWPSSTENLGAFAPVVGGNLSIPAFAAPYPGARFTSAMFSKLARDRSSLDQHWFWRSFPNMNYAW